MITVSRLLTFHFFEVIYKKGLYPEYISPSCYKVPGLVFPIIFSLIESLLLIGSNTTRPNNELFERFGISGSEIEADIMDMLLVS